MASKHESVVQAIEAALKSITAGTNGYVYTPDDVQRVMFFPDEITPDPTMETVYLLRPGLETRQYGPDSCQISGDLELFLIVAKRLSVASENPSGDEPPERWQIAADLVADACQAIFTDQTFGGVAKHLQPASVAVDYERSDETWALAEIRFTVRYLHSRPGR